MIIFFPLTNATAGFTYCYFIDYYYLYLSNCSM